MKITVNCNGQKSKLNPNQLFLDHTADHQILTLTHFLELKSSVTNVTENGQEKPLFLAGDFNLHHIDWENNTIKPGGQSAHSQELLELSEEFGMEQIQMNTTRENNNLDLILQTIQV